MTSGEGGMLVTDDEHLYQEAIIYRDQGKEGFTTNFHVRLGYNWIEDNVIWNVASGEATSIIGLARAMAAVAGRPIEVRYGPRRSGDVDRSLLSTAALRATGLWGLPLPLAEGLRLTLTEAPEVVPVVSAALETGFANAAVRRLPAAATSSLVTATKP
jgi:hypothetical protein